jgi:RNA polymerase sigma factor (sigma-70 family)
MAGQTARASGSVLDLARPGSAGRGGGHLAVTPARVPHPVLRSHLAATAAASCAGSHEPGGRRTRRPLHVLRARRARLRIAPRSGQPRRPAAEPDQLLAELYAAHYTPLVRLAALLTGEVAAAEVIVQDAFVALYRAWWRRDADRTVFYLRRAVVRRCRPAARHRRRARGRAPRRGLDRPTDDRSPETNPPGSAVLAALGQLPGRQREAVVLRYYAELPLEQIGSIMGLSSRAVARHTERARASLPALLAASRGGSGGQCPS